MQDADKPLLGVVVYGASGALVLPFLAITLLLLLMTRLLFAVLLL